MITIQTFHLVQAWLIVDIAAGLWLAYAVRRAPILD